MKDIQNYLEPEEVDLMLEAAQTRSPRDYLLMKVLWQVGIRVNELLHIRPADLNYADKRIVIVKAKGNKQRLVPVKPTTH